MTSTLLNISGKIDPAIVELYDAVKRAADSLDLPFVVVGASAREIILNHAFEIKIHRKTNDVDLGIQLSNWEVFDEVKNQLINAGFSETNKPHHLKSPSNMWIDILPFGQIQDEKANIAWPPNGERIMSVLGFKEALDNAKLVRIREEPPLDIPIASIEGLILLKLIAWTDREDKMDRKKDAQDICNMLKNYERIPEIMNGIYENEKLMPAYDWDGTLAGAYLLGRNAGRITSQSTREAIQNFPDKKIDQLVEEMCSNPEQEFDRNNELFTAFIDGFKNKIF